MAQTFNNKSLDSFGEQVLIGACLGGSSIIKSKKGLNYHLAMKSPNPKWLTYKIQSMRPLFKDELLLVEGKSFRCFSYACQYVTKMHEMLYSNGCRTIRESLLDSLRDVALATWCVEGGGRCGSNKKNFYLTMTRFSMKDAIFTMHYFNNIYEIPCIIKDYGAYRRLQFTVYGTDKLFELVSPHIPEFIE